MMTRGKLLLTRIKPYLRWIILGATLFFIASTAKRHWDEVVTLRIDGRGWSDLAIAFSITLLAHIWSGWVWSWILWALNQPVSGTWGISVYLKTNIAKYLPGNVWHFYGRVLAAKQAGVPTGTAALSVLLEPLLMAAAALAIALVGQPIQPIQVLSLLVVLAAVHPRLLNPLLRVASRLKGRASEPDTPRERLKRYPALPLLGELIFVGLRGTGFVLALLALTPMQPAQILPTISAFSFAWLLGLVVPGAPGGIGIVEATAIALLHTQFPAAVLLGGVAFYRLISTLAEAIGAGLAWAVGAARNRPVN